MTMSEITNQTGAPRVVKEIDNIETEVLLCEAQNIDAPLAPEISGRHVAAANEETNADFRPLTEEEKNEFMESIGEKGRKLLEALPGEVQAFRSFGGQRSTKDMGPSDLNAMARLVLIADRRGPQFLYDADSFDHVLGPGSFAETDSQVRDLARSVIEAPPNGACNGGVLPSDLKENIGEDALQGQ